MKNKKKIIRLVDPEPQQCYPTSCGSHETVERRTRTVLDVIRETVFIPAQRDSLGFYITHDPECAWRQWALREIARRDSKEFR